MPKGVYIRTKESLKNMSIAQKGNTNGFKKGCSSWIKGLHITYGKKFKKGHLTWNKGIELSAEHKKNLSLSHKGRISPMKGKMSGSDNPMWKGGVTSKNKVERVVFRQTMQNNIFARDEYKCQLCGSKQNLQVDHIQKWSTHKNLRFDPNNCRTLCARCHYKVTFNRDMPKESKSWGHYLLKGGH